MRLRGELAVIFVRRGELMLGLGADPRSAIVSSRPVAIGKVASPKVAVDESGSGDLVRLTSNVGAHALWHAPVSCH